MPKRIFTDEEEQKICLQYKEEKVSTLTLAKRYNCGIATIRYIILKKGNKTRTKKETQNTESCKQLQRQNNSTYKGKLRGDRNGMFGRTGEKNPNFGRTGEKSHMYRGGKVINNKGCVYILLKKGIHPFAYDKNGSDYILEHRLIMENFLKEKNPCSEFLIKIKDVAGKWLSPTCTVHHINGIKSDNRVENLKVIKNRGECYSFKTREKIRERKLLQILNHSGPYKDTKPELKMKEILNELNILFEHQFRLGNHLYDFHILNTNILIEVDGDYWHGHPEKFKKFNEAQIKNKQRDEKVNKLAKENNYILLRFWQSDILKNEKEVREKIYNITNI